VFVRVAFPFALAEPLTYSVPDRLTPLVQPGVRVRAPLRRRAWVGLVVETATEAGCPPSAVLPIDEVLDPEPLLPARLLDLVQFAADYYATPVGQVLRAAIPRSLLRLPPPLVEAGPRAVEVLGTATGAAKQLLERLIEARRITVTRLHAEGWGRDELKEILGHLATVNAVRVVERGPDERVGLTVSAVALSEISPEERRLRIGNSPAQERVVAWLEALGRPALAGEVLASCHCSAGVISKLVERGVVRRFRQARHWAPRRWELAPPAPPSTLTVHQTEALRVVEGALEERVFRAFLLLGVTGSGKTEVYLRLAQRVVSSGLQALVLVPEIALTPALAGLLGARFGSRVAVLHSSMPEGERFASWQRARLGAVDVVAGPRSSLWAPLQRLGLIVVDEEQDSSYKQEEEPRYHARDLALVLGQRLGIPVLMASATPSLEVLWLAQRGRVKVMELPTRVAGGALPAVELVDLTKERPEPGEHGFCYLSSRVKELLGETVARREQAILLVNRRGWAPVLLCRECGHQESCRDCSIRLTVHRREKALVCHYCSYRRAIPERCSRCGGEVLEDVGAGTEKVASRVSELLPDARVAILDRDTARSPARLLATLERFAAGGTDVLVGTQMVSKGHHFPLVTLTAVVNADNLLGFPDFRGAEKTFQMLTQVAGRAGRGDRPGRVVIQTYHPGHHAIQAAAAHDPRAFAEVELRYRQAFRYPPCARMALVRFESMREGSAITAAQAAARALEPPPPTVRVVGPSPAPIARLRGRWRVHLLLLAPSRKPLREALSRVHAMRLPGTVHRVIDVDPQSTV